MSRFDKDVIADILLELGLAPGMVERVKLALDPCTLLVAGKETYEAFVPVHGVMLRGPGEQVPTERLAREHCSVGEKALLRSLRAQALNPFGLEPGTEEWHHARIAACNMGLR